MRHLLPRPVSMLVVLVAVLVQVSIVQRVELLHASPDLVVLVVVSVSLLGGSVAGAWYGFIAGVAIALFAALPLGPHAMVATVIGYSCGRWGEVLITDEHPVPPLLAAVAATLAMQIGRPVIEFLINPAVTTTRGVWGEAVVVCAINAVFAVPVYALVRRIVRGMGVSERSLDVGSVREA